VNRIYLYLSGGRGGRHTFTLGTFQDLKAANIEPAPGLPLHFYSDDADDSGKRDDLIFEGIVGYDEQAARWYAIVDEDSIWHRSEEGPGAI